MASLSLALALTLAASSTDVLTLQRPAGGEWHGVYMSGRKVGWIYTAFARKRREDRDVLVATTRTEIAMSVGDTPVRRTVTTVKVYDAKPRGRLLSFEGESEGDRRASTSGRCSAVECVVVFRTEGGTEERRIAVSGDTADVADGPRLVAANRTSVRGASLNALTGSVEQVEMRFARTATLDLDGARQTVSVVETRSQGARGWDVVSVTRDGRILEQRSGGVVAKVEPEHVATQLETLDILELTSVPVPRPLPRAVPGAIRYRLRGVPAAYVSGGRQTVHEQGRELVVTVRAVEPAAADRTRDPSRHTVARGLEWSLAPTAVIDSDHPEIVRTARQITRNDEGVYATARRVCHWVASRVKAVPGAGTARRASDVLANSRVDANAYQQLFLALARAAGVPARGVNGLTFLNRDGKNLLVWAGWVEVLAGSEWIPMDPRLDQPVADATHLALGHGDSLDTTGLIGGIEVLAANPID